MTTPRRLVYLSILPILVACNQPASKPAAAAPSAGGNGAPRGASTTASAAEKPDKPTLTRSLETGLQALAERHLPGHAVDYDSGERFRITWRTQEQDVTRPASKIGRETRVHRELGPTADGLMLTAWVSDELGAAKRPQTIDDGGLWKTYLGQVEMQGPGTTVLFNLSYGPRTNQELIKIFSDPRSWLAAQAGTQPEAVGGVSDARGARPPDRQGRPVPHQPETPRLRAVRARANGARARHRA